MSNVTRTSPARVPTIVSQLGTAAVVGLATLGDYFAWLGRAEAKDFGRDSYQPWQVMGLVLVLGVIAVVAGWRRHPWVAAVVTTLVMTVSWSIDAFNDPPEFNDGLWLIGASMVAIGTFCGVWLVAYATSGVTEGGWGRRKSRAPEGSEP